MKEQKQKEREDNKRKREEERKRKSDERARRAVEKAKDKSKKAAQKARKQKEKVQNPPNTTSNHNTSTSSTRRSSEQPPTKKARVADEAIDDSRCCVCFITYEDDVLNKTGKDWVGCVCGRWLHEECMEESCLDSTGKERLCPLCIDLFAE